MAAMPRVLGAQRRMHARKSIQEVVNRQSRQDFGGSHTLSGRLISLRMSHFKSCERRRAAFLQHAAFNRQEWRSPSMAQGASRRTRHPTNAQATGNCPRQVYEDDTRTEAMKVFFLYFLDFRLFALLLSRDCVGTRLFPERIRHAKGRKTEDIARQEDSTEFPLDVSQSVGRRRSTKTTSCILDFFLQ